MEFKGGKAVGYRGKYVKTERLKVEDKAGKRVFPLLGDFSVPRLFLKSLFWMVLGMVKNRGKLKRYGTANTALEFHHKRLLALMEQDVPYHVDAQSLETYGRYDFGGKLKHNFSAHPKVDPVSGEMVCFGYNPTKNPYLQHSVVNKEGKVLCTLNINLEFPAMIHDFFICGETSVFLIFPLIMSFAKVLQGKAGFHLDKTKPAKIGVLNRYAKSQEEIFWVEISNGYVFHTVNGWKEGNLLHLFAVKFDEFRLGSLGEDVRRKKEECQFLHKWVVDVSSKKLIYDDRLENPQDRRVCEFPVINPRYMGQKNRYTYVVHNDGVAMFRAVSKVDISVPSKVTLELEEGCVCGEFAFGEKEGASREDEGYLFSFVRDEKKAQSFLFVVDASSMKIACKLLIPARVPHGFHGKWLSRKQMDSQISNL